MKEFVFGFLALIVVFYRIIYLMIPMITSGIKTFNWKQVFEALTLLV